MRSQENVEIVRDAFDAVNRRDTEAAIPYLDPEGELQSAIIGAAEGKIYRGHDGFREWMAESAEYFAELRVEPDEWRDLGDEVLVIGRLYARGRGSGVEIDSAIAWHFTLRGGRIVRSRGYLNPREALEAAGLEE